MNIKWSSEVGRIITWTDIIRFQAECSELICCDVELLSYHNKPVLESNPCQKPPTAIFFSRPLYGRNLKASSRSQKRQTLIQSFQRENSCAPIGRES